MTTTQNTAARTITLTTTVDLDDVAAVAAAIKANLKARSGRGWSVTNSRGTGWGWLTIATPAGRLVDGRATEQDRSDLAALLGVSVGGEYATSTHTVGDSRDYRAEYLQRSAGMLPTVTGRPYWD